MSNEWPDPPVPLTEEQLAHYRRLPEMVPAGTELNRVQCIGYVIFYSLYVRAYDLLEEGVQGTEMWEIYRDAMETVQEIGQMIGIPDPFSNLDPSLSS